MYSFYIFTALILIPLATIWNVHRRSPAIKFYLISKRNAVYTIFALYIILLLTLHFKTGIP